MNESALIFRIQLLPRSETFITTQAAALQRFSPFFVGWRRMQGQDLPPGQSWVANEGGTLGRLQELRYRALGPSRTLLRHLRTKHPRLVYAHFALDGFAAMPLARALNVPLVTALHGYDVTMTDEAIGRTRLGRSYLAGRKELQDHGALFLACSSYVRDRALAVGYPPDRTLVHYLGMDAQRFHPKPETAREPIVLFVGRLVEKKGCAVLIRAMAAVQGQHRTAELVVIGDGPLKASLEAEAARLGVRARFLGAQPPAVVMEWMARARIFSVPSVVASTGDAEGFGIVFLEAQAMELPVVSTRSGGIPEAVADHETGLLVAEQDPEQLASAISRLLGDPDLWRQFSLAGRTRVTNHFDHRRQTARLETLFERLPLTFSS